VCSGKIAIGDALISIDGVDCGADHRQAATMLEGPTGSSVSVVALDSAGASRRLALIRQQPVVPTPSKLPDQAGIGVRIERESGSKDAVVKRIAAGSAAALAGTISEGDILTHIGGHSVLGMPCRYSLMNSFAEVPHCF
jgi:C-terminal processing protease CtpA/Prc